MHDDRTCGSLPQSLPRARHWPATGPPSRRAGAAPAFLSPPRDHQPAAGGMDPSPMLWGLLSSFSASALFWPSAAAQEIARIVVGRVGKDCPQARTESSFWPRRESANADDGPFSSTATAPGPEEGKSRS